MSNLISRQAAIDAADRADYTSLPIEDVKKVTDAVIKELKQLPSAQPEQKKGEWIPVTERLPEEYTRVIGFMTWKAMTAIEYQNGMWYSIDHLEPLPDEAVTHWMPLPEPPTIIEAEE